MSDIDQMPTSLGADGLIASDPPQSDLGHYMSSCGRLAQENRELRSKLAERDKEVERLKRGDVPEGWQGEHCQRCGRGYQTVHLVADELWAEITGRTDGGGLLCVECIDSLSREKGLPTIYWYGGAEKDKKVERLRGLLRKSFAQITFFLDLLCDMPVGIDELIGVERYAQFEKEWDLIAEALKPAESGEEKTHG